MFIFSDSLHQCWYVWFNNATMQEYLEETVGSCTRRMILYQVSDITFLMLLCNSLLTTMYLLDCHMGYVMFSHETLIWVFRMTFVVFTHWKLAWHYFQLSHTIFVVNLFLCCAYPFRIQTYLYLPHTPGLCDFDLVIFCCDSSWTGLLLWIYGFVFSIPLFIFTI